MVTPSYNQGRFIEQTITSVLGQSYPNLEYMVLDGGSTDETVEVIERYQKHLSFWRSERDRGQSAAVNEGFARATGDILCWLNSDDMYLPGALDFVARTLEVGRAHLLFGNCVQIRENAEGVSWSTVVETQRTRDIGWMDYVVQPSSFWTRAAWEATGPLDEAMHYVFDWDWFIRAAREQVKFEATTRHLSVYRIHDAHKTGTGGEPRDREIEAIYARHQGAQAAALFRALCERRPLITNAMRVLSRARLGKAAPGLLRLLAPGAARGLSQREIGGILAMVM